MQRIHKTAAAIAVLGLFAIPAQAHEQGDWIARAGIGVVDPKSTSYSDPVEDFSISVDSGTSLTLTGAYFMTDNWAIELLASWPFTHDIDAEIGGVSMKIAETDHLPPTLSLQYFFATVGNFKPYAGVGINYTLFSNTDLVPDLANAGVTLDLDDSVGIAAQIGTDMILNDRWFVNFDLRWISIESDATLFDGVDTSELEVEIDPIVYSVNVGFSF